MNAAWTDPEFTKAFIIISVGCAVVLLAGFGALLDRQLERRMMFKTQRNQRYTELAKLRVERRATMCYQHQKEQESEEYQETRNAVDVEKRS